MFQRRLCAIICFVVLVQSGSGYQIVRRDAFQRFLSVVSGAVVTSSIGAEPAHSVLSSKYCAAGVGDGCRELSEGNELIKSLQEKSAAKKEQYAMETRNAYYMKNYPDYFASTGKILVRKPDGSFMAISEAEADKLKMDNKLTYEIPTAKGGKITDLTQKPIWVLKDY